MAARGPGAGFLRTTGAPWADPRRISITVGLTMAVTLPPRRRVAHARQPEVGIPQTGQPYRASPTRAGERGCHDRRVPSSVLVIDDDSAFRDLARRMLAAGGFAVVGEAGTAAAGIASAHELRPDAALVDVGLPDRDGIALAREIAALPWRPRVVLTSSDPDAVTSDDVHRSGAQAFVPKDELPDAQLGPLLDARRPHASRERLRPPE